MPIGAIVNVITVLIGSSIGLLLRQKFPKNIQLIIFQAIGLSTLVLGMQMALQTEDILIIVFSLILGGIFGEIIHLERGFETLGDTLKSRFGSDEDRFTEGLISTFLLFCVGSMTFIGSINEGLTGDRTLILTKALMDGFTSIALASVYGIGVPFSVIPMFLVQGGLTILASQLQNFFSPLILTQLTAVGGVLMLGISFNLLELKPIKTTNLLPSLIIVVLLTLLFK